MVRRSERVVCCALVVAMWLFFVVQALHTPTILDDWYQVAWVRQHGFGLTSIWQDASYNFHNYNPRMGEVILMIVNGPRWIHVLATPLVQLGFLPLAFVITFARWPRLTYRDFALLLLFQTLIWLLIPVAGVIYFYRPYTTNYVWAFAVMLALFTPLRLELARPVAGPARVWRVPGMFVLGWLAGMGNEHTVFTGILAMAIGLYIAHRMGRLRLWMIAGALGLCIGAAMLMLAPGQALRYGGMGVINTPTHMLRTRGLMGMLDVTLDFVGELEIGLSIVLVAVLVAYRRLPGLTRGQLLSVLAFLFAGFGIIATLFASPSTGERLYFAPAVMVAAALVTLADWVLADRTARRVLLGTCAALFAYQAVRMETVLAEGYEQNQARLALLRAGAPNTIVKVPPYTGDFWKRTKWWWGDDWEYNALREYIAHEVYDLQGTELDRFEKWAEPTPTDRYVIERTFDPPLSPEEDAALEPPYVPIEWEWAATQMRKSKFFGPISKVVGHELVRYRVNSVGGRFVDPKGRPIRVFEWTPQKLRFVDGRPFDDPDGTSYLRIWEPSMPPDVTDVYVEGCGQTARVELRSDRFKENPGDYHVGPLVPINLACRGTHTAYVCQQDLCWLAGRYWQ